MEAAGDSGLNILSKIEQPVRDAAAEVERLKTKVAALEWIVVTLQSKVFPAVDELQAAVEKYHQNHQ